jgi:hypothetical protein
MQAVAPSLARRSSSAVATAWLGWPSIDPATTSLPYNIDNRSDVSPLALSGSYTWSVSVVDAHHNRARQEKSYNVLP